LKGCFEILKGQTWKLKRREKLRGEKEKKGLLAPNQRSVATRVPQ